MEINFTRRKFLFSAVSIGGFSSCNQYNNTLDDLFQGEVGHVSSVRDGDTLVLENGLTVRLSGIEAPRKAYHDRVADPYGEEAAEMLEFLTLGRRAQLYYGGLTRDRYSRALAHIIVWDEAGQKIWVNGAMVRQGGARVRTWPDNVARVEALYDFEGEARDNQVGLWGFADYQPQPSLKIRSIPYGLCLFEGSVNQLMETRSIESFCVAGENGGFNVSLGLRMARSQERTNLTIGDQIRIRGLVRRANANIAEPHILLDHWQVIELLASDA